MKRYKPFILTVFVILLDQVVKALVIHYIPEEAILGDYLWGFLRIWHVRNDAVAFSFGTAFPLLIKYIFFVFLPLCLMVAISYVIVSPRYDEEITPFQHWLLAGIVGGGVGNLIDRIFRHLRVVDFISTRMYGAFGMEWFPTYNIADSAVVISVCLLIISLLLDKKGKKSE